MCEQLGTVPWCRVFSVMARVVGREGLVKALQGIENGIVAICMNSREARILFICAVYVALVFFYFI
jgi:hypothetical protein